jgi:hypothetical protein
MTPLVDNPFAVLTTVVAPAVLTNACSVLCLGTSNRIARVVDQSRMVGAELEALAPDSPEKQRWEQQFTVLRSRARHLFWALRLFYASLGAFAAAALIAVVGSAIAASSLWSMFQAAAAVGLAVGTAGVGGLTVGCALMVGEVRLALKQTADEADRILSRPPKAIGSSVRKLAPAIAVEPH